MKLHEQWQEICEMQRAPEEQKLFWETYFAIEMEAYKIILSEKNNIVEGTIAELADKFDMTKTQVVGFIDGINTSLEEEIDLDSLEADTKVTLTIIWEKLYENMLNAKADWLYSLTEWDPIITIDQRDIIRRDFNRSRMAVSEKVGRNDPCTCGSGLKYKKCCGK